MKLFSRDLTPGISACSKSSLTSNLFFSFFSNTKHFIISILTQYQFLDCRPRFSAEVEPNSKVQWKTPKASGPLSHLNCKNEGRTPFPTCACLRSFKKWSTSLWFPPHMPAVLVTLLLLHGPWAAGKQRLGQSNSGFIWGCNAFWQPNKCFLACFNDTNIS